MPTTAEQALASLQELNQKEIAPLSKRVRERKPLFYIFNVSPKRWIVELGSLGPWTILACEPGKEYSRATVVPESIPEGIPTDMKKIEHRIWDGEEVLKDILGIGPYKRRDQDLTRWGVFYSKSETPSKAEVSAAKKAYHERLIELVKEADEYFQQGPMEIRNISADMREACSILNLDRPWAKATIAMIQCPGCGEAVNPNAAVHAGKDGCGAVLNKAKVIELRLPGYDYLWQTSTK